MATIKLTNSMRDMIENRLVKGKFEKEEAQLKEKMRKIGDKFYKDLYTPSQLKLLASLPSTWCIERSEFYVHIDGQGTSRITLTKPMRLHIGGESAYRYHEANIYKIYEATHPLVEERRQARDEIDNLATARKELRMQVRGVLNSVTTLGKLVEVWPEIQSYITDLWTPPASAGVPAVVIEDLNKLLNLKKAA